MAPLEAFSHPPHQSTLEQLQISREDSASFDPDGIVHSFERSTATFGQVTYPPFGLSAFQIPQESGMVDITGELEKEEEAQPANFIGEENETGLPPQSIPQNLLVEEGPTLSPFTMYLNRVSPPAQATHKNQPAVKTQADSMPSVPSSNFVTSSDLESLERRLQVLVSEATASISSQLQTRTTSQANVSSQSSSADPPRNKTPRHFLQTGLTSTRPKRNPATRRIQQQERERELRLVRETSHQGILLLWNMLELQDVPNHACN